MRYHRDENEHFIFNGKNHFSIEHKTWCTNYLDYSSLILFGFLHFAYSQVQLPFFFSDVSRLIESMARKRRSGTADIYSTIQLDQWPFLLFFFLLCLTKYCWSESKKQKNSNTFFFLRFLFLSYCYISAGCWFYASRHAFKSLSPLFLSLWFFQWNETRERESWKGPKRLFKWPLQAIH